MSKTPPDTMPRSTLPKHSLWRALEKCQSKCVYLLSCSHLGFVGHLGGLEGGEGEKDRQDKHFIWSFCLGATKTHVAAILFLTRLPEAYRERFDTYSLNQCTYVCTFIRIDG